MATNRKPWVWISLVTAGALVGALGVVFVVLGLDKANQLAGVLGAFVGIGGLGASIYGLVLARHSASQASSLLAPTDGSVTADGERSVAVRDNSGVIQTGDDSSAQR